ncbi:MAG: HEPN domain-containing protein [Ruminococcaceae bacterium]|nr:HEPN domain-containing protein [Oscillospiraceae bacterium]
MADSRRYNDWYDKARHDLDGARVLVEHGGIYDLAAFHCQQAIEKALKGWLLQHTGRLHDGHSLVFLSREAKRRGAKIDRYMRDCAFVNQFYIETRYPADIPTEVSREDAAECCQIAEDVMEALMKIDV